MSETTTAAMPKKAKTKVHNEKALREAMAFSPREWNKARWAELVPAADRAAGTWSGHLVDDLVVRAEEIRAAIPDVLDADELSAALGMDWGQWRRASEAGLLPACDAGPYWTRPAAAALLADPAAFLASIPSQPLGSRRCADLLKELTGLAVHADDLPALAEDDHVRVAGEYEGFDLYDVDRLRRLPEDAAAMTALADLVRARAQWIAASLLEDAAAARIQFTVKEFRRAASERDVAPGWGGRYAQADIDALADDQELMDRVRRARMLGPDQAADHLEIRETDLAYLVSAGLLAPDDHVDVPVGRVKEVRVPLYSVGQLEDVQKVEWIDWEELRAVKPGQRSRCANGPACPWTAPPSSAPGAGICTTPTRWRCGRTG